AIINEIHDIRTGKLDSKLLKKANCMKGAEAAIKAEQTAKVALTISEKNQATLVEINKQVFCLGKTLQDSWWQ
ncbi:6629_t:CDS:2, partial [Entrophospora sp. SA101]